MPNPFTNDILITYNLPTDGNITINITDALGRVVETTEANARKGLNSMQFSTAEYPKGIYSIRIIFNGVVTQYKTVVKK